MRRSIETQVYEDVTRHLKRYHSDLIWHWDLAGVHNPSKVTRALYSRLNKPGWPDFLLDEPRFMPGTIFPYHGLRIEVKPEGARLTKQNGAWASDHIARQAAQRDRLRDKGYVAEICRGSDEFLAVLHSYLGEPCQADEADDGSVF